MPRNKTSNIVEGYVLEILHQGYSQSRIVHILKLNGINISQLSWPSAMIPRAFIVCFL